jgi:hypothetical protein
VFRSQRANAAWYRAELAHELRQLGLEVRSRTGRDGRFFELQGVPDALVKRWSRRSEVIERAAREFGDRCGREPHPGELSSIAVATRGTKTDSALLGHIGDTVARDPDPDQTKGPALLGLSSAPGEIRTPDLRFRSLLEGRRLR